jgi:hypothetical protein
MAVNQMSRGRVPQTVAPWQADALSIPVCAREIGRKTAGPPGVWAGNEVALLLTRSPSVTGGPKGEPMKTIGAFVAIALFVLASPAINASSQWSDTYIWSGELVGFDPNTRVITVKSRLVNEHELGTMSQFKPGDRIALIWSGYNDWAAGISRAARYDGGQKVSDRFTLPVDFVGFDTTTKYLTFKFQVPAGSVDAVKAVKPGHWITATSKHRPSSDADSIMAVKSYVVSSSTSTSN